jgi:hypothetical protein
VEHAQRQWCERVAEAARRAVEELEQLPCAPGGTLLADLRDLHGRLLLRLREPGGPD